MLGRHWLVVLGFLATRTWCSESTLFEVAVALPAVRTGGGTLFDVGGDNGSRASALASSITWMRTRPCPRSSRSTAMANMGLSESRPLRIGGHAAKGGVVDLQQARHPWDACFPP